MSRSGPSTPRRPLPSAARLVTDLVDITSDLAALDGGSGFWVVVLPYDGAPVCARFAHASAAAALALRKVARARPQTPGHRAWTRAAGPRRSADIRAAIAAGDVYQVNLTRRLSAPLPAGADVFDSAAELPRVNPAPYGAVVRIPGMRQVACASPELFLRRDGNRRESGRSRARPPSATGFLAKDRAENVMIVDLVRNDLGRVYHRGR